MKYFVIRETHQPSINEVKGIEVTERKRFEIGGKSLFGTQRILNQQQFQITKHIKHTFKEVIIHQLLSNIM